jgi:hypothetical protein
MEPGLRDGDWLLVDPLAFARRAPQVGDLVLARDPRARDRLLVKRVRSMSADGPLTIGGDHRAHEEETIPIDAADVVGRPWFRYWPLRAFGRIT